MKSKYWIKLYHEVLDDPKMGRLSDRLWRRTIEVFLLAGDTDEEGKLPALDDMAWRLRIIPEELEADLIELQRVGIVLLAAGVWSVGNFEERQRPSTSTERSRRHRAMQRKCNDDATKCNAYREEKKEIKRKKRGRGEKTAHQSAPSAYVSGKFADFVER